MHSQVLRCQPWNTKKNAHCRQFARPLPRRVMRKRHSRKKKMHYVATIRSNWLNEEVLTLWSQFILLWASGKTANTSRPIITNVQNYRFRLFSWSFKNHIVSQLYSQILTFLLSFFSLSQMTRSMVIIYFKYIHAYRFNALHIIPACRSRIGLLTSVSCVTTPLDSPVKPRRCVIGHGWVRSAQVNYR